MAIAQFKTGEIMPVASGTPVDNFGGRQGDDLVSELMPFYYEQNYRGNLWYCGSTAEVALSANTITLTATTTPIVGIWNPSTSQVNCVLVRSWLAATLQAASSTRQGAFVWAMSLGNGAISTGSAPFNAKTLSTTGPKGASATKAFNGGIALTAITNNLVIQRPSLMNIGLAITTNTVTAATVVPCQTAEEWFRGSLFVPPGGVLALLNTNSTTNLSCVAGLEWIEVPI